MNPAKLKEIRVPMDLRKALKASPKAKAQWADITPFARRDWILWIITAKQKETHRRRIKKACDMLSHGKRRVCCFGGIKWLMKNHSTLRNKDFFARMRRGGVA